MQRKLKMFKVVAYVRWADRWLSGTTTTASHYMPFYTLCFIMSLYYFDHFLMNSIFKRDYYKTNSI